MEVGEEQVELPSGRVVDHFLWVRTREFAMAVAVTPEGHIVVERSYKHGPRKVGLSLPAGYLEPGEAPADTARRELREETGYEADDWTSLGSFTVDGNYGVSTEHVFLAKDARQVVAPDRLVHDDLEEIEVLTMPLADVLAALGQGEVVQLSSAAAIAIAALTLR